MIDTITLPIFYENKVLKDENGKTIWDEDGNPKIEKIWHTYHSFALQLPDGEYYIQNSDNQYNNCLLYTSSMPALPFLLPSGS